MSEAKQNAPESFWQKLRNNLLLFGNIVPEK